MIIYQRCGKQAAKVTKKMGSLIHEPYRAAWLLNILKGSISHCRLCQRTTFAITFKHFHQVAKKGYYPYLAGYNLCWLYSVDDIHALNTMQKPNKYI